MSPEERARLVIDEKLKQAGWVIQDMNALNLAAAPGVAIREFPTSTGEVDYALFVDGRPVGVAVGRWGRSGREGGEKTRPEGEVGGDWGQVKDPESWPCRGSPGRRRRAASGGKAPRNRSGRGSCGPGRKGAVAAQLGA